MLPVVRISELSAIDDPRCAELESLIHHVQRDTAQHVEYATEKAIMRGDTMLYVVHVTEYRRFSSTRRRPLRSWLPNDGTGWVRSEESLFSGRVHSTFSSLKVHADILHIPSLTGPVAPTNEHLNPVSSLHIVWNLLCSRMSCFILICETICFMILEEQPHGRNMIWDMFHSGSGRLS